MKKVIECPECGAKVWELLDGICHCCWDARNEIEEDEDE